MPFNNFKLCMGPGTLEIPTDLYALNRQRLVERLRTKDLADGAVVLLQGGQDISIYDTDVCYVFRQESNFRWAFGVLEPSCYGIIDIDSGEPYLFIPRLPDEYAIWMGPLPPLEEFRIKYDIERIHYSDEMEYILKTLQPSSVLVVKGFNSDSGLESDPVDFEGMNHFLIDSNTLFPEITDLRVFKTNYELDVLKYVAEVSSVAHQRVMKIVKSGITEFQCEAEFMHYAYSVGGCRNVSYTCICSSGSKSSVLHYGHAGEPNDKTLIDGDMCLFDMGANYFGYAADITCSFPVNGKFTNDQKMIYESVLAANLAVAREARPGISWACMHILANRILLSELKDGGLLQGDVSVMVTAGLGSIFQPHGLGHLIGLDVHDVGGYLPDTPPRLKHPKGIEKLRTCRILKKNMVLTIEPGCYFIDCLLDSAIADPILSQFLVMEVLDRFRSFGGVRIEDMVVITEIGCQNLVNVPRTVEEIEAWMAPDDVG